MKKRKLLKAFTKRSLLVFTLILSLSLFLIVSSIYFYNRYKNLKISDENTQNEDEVEDTDKKEIIDNGIFEYIDQNDIYNNIKPVPDEIPKDPTPEQPLTTKCPYDKEINRINTQNKIVALTFDAGGTLDSFDTIISILAKYNIKASFFVTGGIAKYHPEVITQIYNSGHDIFNHTYNHPNLTTLSDADIHAELQSLEDLIFSMTGHTTKPFFRPPYGARDSRVISVACTEGYTSIYWTVDTIDWRADTTVEDVKNRVLNNLAPGNIYLLHIGSKVTKDAIEDIVIGLQNAGYSNVALSDVL